MDLLHEVVRNEVSSLSTSLDRERRRADNLRELNFVISMAAFVLVHMSITVVGVSLAWARSS